MTAVPRIENGKWVEKVESPGQNEDELATYLASLGTAVIKCVT